MDDLDVERWKDPSIDEFAAGLPGGVTATISHPVTGGVRWTLSGHAETIEEAIAAMSGLTGTAPEEEKPA